MRRFSSSSIAAVAILLTLLSLGAAKPKYIHPKDVDWAKILPPPPAAGSDEAKADLAAVLEAQKTRTPEEIARCKAEAPANAFYFKKVLGNWFNAKSLPVTATLMEQALIDANNVSETAKAHYKRPRPYVADSRVHPVLAPEKAASYPSGHAVRGIVWATLLSEMFPEHKDELMAAGKQFGDDRVIAGMHYPSDVAAGQKLGAAIAQKLLDDPAFKADLEKAKDECLSAAH